MNEQEYYNEFMNDVYASSSIDKQECETKFTELMCDFLVEQAALESFDLAFHKQTREGIRLDAWNYNRDKQIVTLIASDFNIDDEIKTLTKTDADKYINRLERFFEKSTNQSFYRDLDEAFPAYGVAREIFENKNEINRINFILITNSILSSRLKNITREKFKNYDVSYDIWDIGRKFGIISSGKEKEDVEIDFTNYLKNGLPSLKAYRGDDISHSFLLVLPGDILQDIYDLYGERLLEQNVRTFLQFRSGVNKAIRNTITNEPDMFFAYNNGLTATAESVELKDNNIQSITNLQIVNGGQTTASIFMSKLQDKSIDLSKIHVQVKLSVVDPGKVEEIVPKISEYANTQNKVNAADFFSNHPFHRRIEDFSRRALAPREEGSLISTYWYYERARGQYQNHFSKMTPAKQKEHKEKNPKNQMFTKTDLAKFENSFAQLPHFVSKGAQWNFGKFAERICGNDSKKGLWEKNENHFNELYFKNLISKFIIFRFLDKNIMRQSWYVSDKGFIITYTIAKFSQLVSNAGLFVDFDSIWKNQTLTKELQEQLLDLAKIIDKIIRDTTPGLIGSWCKKELCWQRVQSEKVSLNSNILNQLKDSFDLEEGNNQAEREQKILVGIEAQTYVVEKGQDYWLKLIEWNEDSKILSDGDVSFLTYAYKGVPSEKQCPQIMKIEKRAIYEGFNYSK